MSSLKEMTTVFDLMCVRGIEKEIKDAGWELREDHTPPARAQLADPEGRVRFSSGSLDEILAWFWGYQAGKKEFGG